MYSCKWIGRLIDRWSVIVAMYLGLKYGRICCNREHTKWKLREKYRIILSLTLYVGNGT